MLYWLSRDYKQRKEVNDMSMLPPAPHTPDELTKNGTPRQRAYRPRNPYVSRIVADFLNAHPHTEFSVDGIAKQCDLTNKQARQALARLKKQGVAKPGELRDFWALGNGTRPAPRTTTPLPKAPVVESRPVSVKGMMMEVLRPREDGTVVLVDENGGLWVATFVDV